MEFNIHEPTITKNDIDFTINENTKLKKRLTRINATLFIAFIINLSLLYILVFLKISPIEEIHIRFANSFPVDLLPMLVVLSLIGISVFIIGNIVLKKQNKVDKILYKCEIASKRDCITIVDCLFDSTVNNYRDFVIEQNRQFIKGEVEMITLWMEGSASRLQQEKENEACRTLYGI